MNQPEASVEAVSATMHSLHIITQATYGAFLILLTYLLVSLDSMFGRVEYYQTTYLDARLSKPRLVKLFIIVHRVHKHSMT